MFSYAYFMINVKHVFNLETMWKEELDPDGDGVLSRLELRQLAVLLEGSKAVTPVFLKNLEAQLHNGTRAHLARLTDQKDADLQLLQSGSFNQAIDALLSRVSRSTNVSTPAPTTVIHTPVTPSVASPTVLVELTSTAAPTEHVLPITIDSIRECPDIVAHLTKLVQARKKYKHEQKGEELVEFYMVGENATQVEARLDQIRLHRKKFVCLNDDIKSRNPDPRVFQVLNDHFETSYPIPSPFEHPRGVRNAHLHMSDYRKAQAATLKGWGRRALATAAQASSQLFTADESWWTVVYVCALLLMSWCVLAQCRKPNRPIRRSSVEMLKSPGKGSLRKEDMRLSMV
jgi:thiamine phosphate synthase YjbQ (UPF0047 family)